MTNLHFIARCKAGTERLSLLMAAQRLQSVWMPFALESRRTGRKGKRASHVKVNPVMPYLFCEGTGDQMRHMLDHQNIFGTVWFVPERSRAAISRYRDRVEGSFSDSIEALRRDERAFHCTYKPGQAVNLRMAGEELIPAVFREMTDAGDYQLDVDMLGSATKVIASPYDVSAA